MADFGNAGSRIVRTSVAGLKVNTSDGESLFYRVTVKGADAAFVFVCLDRTLLSSTGEHDHPKQVYEWKWPSDRLTIDKSDDRYGVRFSFLPAIKYTLLVEHRDSDDGVIAVVKDIDYESQNPSDQFQEGLRVLSV